MSDEEDGDSGIGDSPAGSGSRLSDSEALRRSTEAARNIESRLSMANHPDTANHSPVHGGESGGNVQGGGVQQVQTGNGGQGEIQGGNEQVQVGNGGNGQNGGWVSPDPRNANNGDNRPVKILTSP